MAVSFTNFRWWDWTSKEKEKPLKTGTSNPPPNSTLDSTKFRSVSSFRKVKRKWSSKEQRRIDRECEAVMVPSDVTCLSDSECDDSDWSIGWLEPHGSDFLSEDDDDDDADNSFAVLVPCYRSGCKEVTQGPEITFLSAINAFSNDYAAESKKLMEQWLSSLES